MSKEDLRVETRVVPSPGNNEYRISISFTIDRRILFGSNDKVGLILNILKGAVLENFARQITGTLALGRLLPVNRTRRLIMQCMDEAERNKRIITEDDISEYLREHGEGEEP